MLYIFDLMCGKNNTLQIIHKSNNFIIKEDKHN